jgi:S-methylmethionine-dependent homocysteine/selenocysteine methylase
VAPGIPRDRVLVLDGATGTELQARGHVLALPLWSAGPLLDAPAVVTELHRKYLDAGADVLTANTFRTNPRAFRRAGLGDEAARAATFTAVGCARRAFGSSVARRVLLAGSMAPVEDCYHPELVPPDSELVEEHALLAGWLAEAGVDVVLLETMNTAREALAALDAARGTGLPAWVSFLTGPDPARLLSGEPLVEAAAAAVVHGAVAVGVNCVPPEPLRRGLTLLSEHLGGIPLIGYPNGGHVDEQSGHWEVPDALDDADYARQALEWVSLGARVIGGCCGTSPTLTSALRRSVDKLTTDPYDPP